MNEGPGTIAVVLNAGSGSDQAEANRKRIGEAFERGGVRAGITMVQNGAELRAAIARARTTGATAIVAAGGDGTISTVAGALAGRDLTLGVIPLGTLNHFARDLELPLDLEAAVAVVVEAHVASIDVGEVNGRVFINNCSLGLYPRVVRLRQQHPVRGAVKWIVAAWAALWGLIQHRPIVLRVEVDGEPLTRRTPVLVVGNNPYRDVGFDGSRDSVAGGRLAIYIVRTFGRLQLMRLAWKMFVGRTTNLPELEFLEGSQASIDVPGRPVLVAVDGELERFAVPLVFRIRPLALRVFVPAPARQDATAQPPPAMR